MQEVSTPIDHAGILQIERMGKIDFNPNNFLHIDSIKYKEKFASLTTVLPEKFGFRYLTACLYFNANERFFLSNDPAGIAIPYYLTPIGRIDTLFLPEWHEGEDHFFPGEETDPMKYASTMLAQKIYALYPGYVLVRSAGEFLVFISATNDKAIHDPRELYRKTVDGFEDFIVYFLDQTISIVKVHKPCFQYLRFFTDPSYRKTAIKNRKRSHHHFELSQKHIGCLQLTAFGKTPREIGTELCLSPTTVPTYIKRIQRKLATKTVAQAVAKAIRLGLITPPGE